MSLGGPRGGGACKRGAETVPELSESLALPESRRVIRVQRRCGGGPVEVP